MKNALKVVADAVGELVAAARADVLQHPFPTPDLDHAAWMAAQLRWKEAQDRLEDALRLQRTMADVADKRCWS